ncbi:hypothetical protein NDU88_003411 [Pleurodeles waltl]|uniref:Endonuclease/exonuclease/phosphatase domain-containing protein n=1 Tax=Pleurodeles waltl TaxID=8319 RepID=A0AAV7LF73_PLEWA|nr:hypothetical protein NDU88_003411 [Pleurodeles waltl]
MASCPSLCEIESDDIKQIGFILSPEGEEVTKALFHSDYIRRVVLQAEAELMKKGIRVVQGNATKDVIHDRRALRCHAGQVDLYNVIGGAKQLLILNVYIQPGNVFDYNIQRGLFEEDLELLCTGNAGCLTSMLGDFNHKLDTNGSDNSYKELLAAAQIPRSIFPTVERSARDLSLARILGSLGMFCLNGRMKNDRPAKKTFRTGDQECPIDYAFVNT